MLKPGEDTMKRTLLISFAILTLCDAMVAQIQISIEFDKRNYLQGEPVFIAIDIENSGNGPIEINRPSVEGGYMIFELTNRSGEKLVYFGPIATARGRNTVILQAGETSSKIYDLTEMYGNLISRSFRRFELKPSTYQIRVVYHPIEGDVVKSDILQFVVIEPTGVEAVAYGKLREALNSVDAGASLSAAPIFVSNVQDHPQSTYSPLSLNFAATIYKMGMNDVQMALDLNRRIISDYPNSGLIKDAISSLRGLSRPELQALIRNLKEKTDSNINRKIIYVIEKGLEKSH